MFCGNVESDGSECWEDFFGSTTDLSSMLHLYDKMKSTEFKEAKSSEENLVEALANLEKIIEDKFSKSTDVSNIDMPTTCVSSNIDQQLFAQSNASTCTFYTKSNEESFKNKMFPLSLSRNSNKLAKSCDDLVETKHIKNTESFFDDMPVELVDEENISNIHQARKSSVCSGHSDTSTLIEINPLKMTPDSKRPLSVCSTSSSSSFGSDNLHEKHIHGISYLASVESLAEQSEAENEKCIRLSVCERACLEIVDSEKNYVNDLRQIINGYLGDWRERACLKTDELNILFSNIEQIYEFNKELLAKLEDSKHDPVKIANCFINLKDGFRVYTTYCTSYPQAISLLTLLLQASHTNALLASTQKMLQHNLPLGSYLLKPVQRILKYHLLLNNLKKNCDVDKVKEAYEIMCSVANDIDQVKRKLEQLSRVKELSGILDGWLGPELTVLGELKHEGILMENNKHRMVFLFESMIIIAKPKEDNRLQFKHYINKKNLMLREHLPGEPTSFCIIPLDEPRNQIKLTAKNRDLKKIWAHHIKEMMLELYDHIPNRAKELLFKLGDEEDRTPDKTWKWSLNSSTPNYLERRNQYRRSEINNRKKLKRKTFSNNSLSKSENEDSEHQKFSIDDNMIQSLTQIQKPTDESLEVSKTSSLKERSKSMPRRLSISFRDSSPKDKKDNVKIIQYNNENVPKRIANMKKNRKETSTFYVAMNDTGENLLKITESAESLTKRILNDHVQSNVSKNVKTESSNEIKQFMKDSEIISELLKDKIGSKKLLKKKNSEFYKKKSLPKTTSLPAPFLNENEEIMNETISKNISSMNYKSPQLQRSKSYNFSSKTKTESLIQRNSSAISTNSSPSTLIQKSKDKLNLESRRNSHNIDLRPQFLHLQGSKALGERMANTDYAVPSSLFKIQNLSIKQKDSEFSLTSSSDSVCDKNKTSSLYEENVEARLENEFRDSAFYSDENMPNSFIQATNKYIKYPKIPPKPKNIPPVTTKTYLRSQLSLPSEFVKIENFKLNKSWVHSQIKGSNG